MNIKNQIRLSVLISLLLVAAISVSIIVSYQNMQDLQHQEDLAADVVRGGYELTYLSNDYLINAEPRAHLQWEERYASLQPIISQLKPENEEEAQSLVIIRDYNEKTGTLFREIPEPGELSTGAVLFPASYQQVTWSRINVQSQGMIYEAWRLRHLYNDDVTEARYWNNILVLALMMTMLVIITVNYLLISRRLVRSIREVNAGSEVFATGNLDYRIPVTSDDEIGGIARRLNTMAEQIRNVTASRDELDREKHERQRSEEALQESAEYLNKLIDYANAPIIVWSPDFTITRFNHAFERLTGRTEQEVIGQSLDILFPEESRAASLTLIRNTLKGERWENVKIPILATDGTVRTVLWNSANILTAGAELVSTIAQGMDITESERADAALRESERKYRNLYQYSQVGLFETSFRDGKVVACNRRYAELAGFASIEEAIGKEILPLYVNADDRTEVGRILREQGYIENHTVKFRNQATGRIFWGQFSARFNYEREVAEGTIIDVTAQKEAETEIRDSKNFLDNIIEQSPNPIWISDEKGTLLRLNKACYELLRITPEEVIGRYNVLEDSIVEAQGKMPLVRSVFEEGKSVNFDLEYDSKLLSSLSLEQSVKVFLNVTIFPVRDTTGRITNAVIQHLDFTERRKAEAQLTAAEQQYRELFESVNIGILRSTPGPQGTIIEANPAAMRIFEADSREQLLAARPSDLYYDADQRRKISEEILAKGVIKGMEIRYKTLKGKPIWGRINSIKKISRDGETYFDNTIEDITRRREMEDALRESEVRFRTIADWTYDWEYWIDEQKKMIYTSPSVERITGYHPDDFKAIPDLIDRIVHPDDRGIWDTHIPLHTQIEFGNDPVEIEFRIVTRDGETRWIGHICRSICSDTGICIGRRVTNRDITDRKRAEEVIRENEKILSNTVEKFNESQSIAHIGSLELDIPTGKVWWSDELYRIFEMEPETYVPSVEANAKFVHPEDNEPFHQEVFAAFSTGGQVDRVIRIITPAGRTKYCRFIAKVILDDDKKAVKLIGTFNDITDRKLAEVQREALIKELEQKNAELERFTYTVSHDLKSPLITIKGFASLLEDDARTGGPLLLKKDISRIMAAAETMQDLLADVLELARVGKIVSPLENIPFLKIADEAVDLLAGPLAERGVTVEIAPDLPDVYADHARIREVMTNLIENAVKFLGDQEKPVIRIGVDRSGKIPVIFVQDNGIGINPHYLERIFNLFEKLDASAPGTGVGLTIVKRIIEVHGGKIWAESEGPGKGTAFKFTLPGVPADEGE